MKKQYQRKPLPGHHREMGVRDSAAEAVQTARAAKPAKAVKAAKPAGTANPAEAGKALPPNQPPGDNAPVTRTEFREEIHKLDKRVEVGFADTDRKISDTKAELNKSI
ncbi:MAG: hypothetical protein OXU34_06285, partial [Gammaproteobacteria bacterium]|nr:hypothetical protein [Gammaproteobacteria bacterium]